LEKGLSRLARIAQVAKEFSWIVGHTEDCSMEHVLIARRGTMVPDAAFLMPLKKQLRNGRKPSRSLNLG
jgi:hypothetical protein